jgi:hypothetical protein
VATDPIEQARTRRLAAAQVSRDFASVDDLAELLSVAEHGFAVLFAGGSVIQLGVATGARYLGGGRESLREQLDESVTVGLGGERNPDVISERPGVLLLPESATCDCRAWIQFPQPRRISVEELIVADLFAQAFALAVDRLISLDAAQQREQHLNNAIEGHRIIGQAVGILVERHKIRPAAAFELLKSASQRRNIKLREIAGRVVETGQEPGQA